MTRTSFVFAVLAAAAGLAHADEMCWVAQVSIDGREIIEIVDTSEAGCEARLAQFADAVIVAACQPEPVALRITDPNDANKSVGPRRPRC